VLLLVTETSIDPLWGLTQSLPTALYATSGEGLAIRYGSVVVYRLMHKKHANCTLTLQAMVAASHSTQSTVV
jgi:hypothetical protein